MKYILVDDQGEAIQFRTLQEVSAFLVCPADIVRDAINDGGIVNGYTVDEAIR